MRSFREFAIFGSVFLLSTASARAAPFGLSDEVIDRYFQILEVYVLPFMVVSTVVLFCGYLASRLYHRSSSRDDDALGSGATAEANGEKETEEFLRGLQAAPPITETDGATDDGDRKARPHPLLRRRAAMSAKRAEEEAAPPDPKMGRDEEPAGGQGLSGILAKDEGAAVQAGPTPVGPEIEKPARRVPDLRISPEDRLSDTVTTLKKPADRKGEVPRLQAAFRQPPSDPAPEPAPPEIGGTSERIEPSSNSNEIKPVIGPAEPPHEQSPGNDMAAKADDDDRLSPARIERLKERAHALLDEGGDSTQDVDPPVVRSDLWRDDKPAEPCEPEHRKEPTVSVVQTLQASANVTSASSERAKARAAEIIDSLDYIASVLQQASVLLADRVKDKQGLALEEVQGLRISGYDEPEHVLEDLRELGGDVPEEVLAAYAAVSGFNDIVVRLEQMAQFEPLDEGWNDLIRARVSDTIYKVGQVRKTLGVYRRGVRTAAVSGESLEDESEDGTDNPVPLGRRQI